MPKRRLRLLVAVAGLSLTLAGCGGSLARRARRGDDAGVVAKVEGRRRPPRGATARLYARSLAALEHFDRAQRVLYEDFRRGGDVRSLVALAELEHRHDRPSLAALHFVRAFDLQPSALSGRELPCVLWDARAAGLIALGEGRAAEAMLLRSERLCAAPSPDRAERHARLRSVLDPLLATEGASASLSSEVSRPPTPPPTTEPAPAIAMILAAGRGEAGLDILPDDVLRRELEGLRWTDLAPIVMAEAEPEAAYLQLRLGAVLDDVPQTPAPRRGVSEANLWLAKALESPSLDAWRLLGWVGDLASAELALRSRWDRPDADGSPEPRAAEGRPEHWSARQGPPSPELGVAARFRAAGGKRALALMLLRDHARDPERVAWVRDEAQRALAWGRPWTARAIVEALALEGRDPVAAAVETTLILADAVCGGPCNDADEATAIEVMGEAWMTGVRAAWAEPALGPIATRLGGPRSSAVTRDVLARAWAGDAPSAGALVAALESEIVWGEAETWLLPLLAQHPNAPEITAFLDRVAIATPLEASSELAVAARLAIVSGDRDRAEAWLDRAAAVAVVPEAVYWDAVVTAAEVDAFEIQRWALHRLAIATTGAPRDGAERELVVHAIRDLERSWGERETEAGRDAVAHQVLDALASRPPTARPDFRRALRERLATVAAAEAWTHDLWASLPIGAAVSPNPEAFWDDEALSGAVRARLRGDVPVATETLADPIAFEGTREAIARHARAWDARRAAALGLIGVGSSSARARALAVLRELAGPQGRERVDARILGELRVLVPGVVPARSAPLVDDPALVARLVLGLDLEPALVAP